MPRVLSEFRGSVRARLGLTPARPCDLSRSLPRLAVPPTPEPALQRAHQVAYANSAIPWTEFEFNSSNVWE